MKIRTKQIAWTTIGCALALLGGGPAFADDTELLLLNPDLSPGPKPNVMFILDTSGSMTTAESTVAPYDSALTYSGTCDNSAVYWTDVAVTPVCDGSETQYVFKSAFVCAGADRQLSGIGSFTNTMVQYRQEAAAAATWQYLEPGNHTDLVECQVDSGVHGDGSATGKVYAASGSGLSDPYTAVAANELSWGSAPRNLSYTIFDGNYLNWKASPVTVSMTRNQIMISVIRKVLNSVSNMNVGIMRFNNLDGGPVIKAMQDLDTNRAGIISTIDMLPADGRTPLAETLYESALYWRGLPAHYGQLINETPTDPAALISTGPEVYAQPAVDVCAKNYNVLLTDGEPVDDLDAQTLAPTLPEFDTALGRTACTGTALGDCLDDIAEYLSVVDTDSTQTGTQTVTTHTIGFTINLPILADTARVSGGQYFLADDVETLTVALLQILANINDRSLSFSAPAVSVNTFNRTQNLNDLYLTMFGAKSNAHWPGNLKKYKIVNRTITDANDAPAVNPLTGFFFDTALSIWTVGGADGNDVRLGGAAHALPDPSIRNLYTNNGASNDLSAANNQITPSNAAAFLDSDFGLTGAAGEPTKDELIRWMRGEDVRDEDGNAATTVRNAMGDPLHSQPAALVYGGTAANPDVVIYTATNDGYLHAVNGSTGVELWSFVPKELLPNMTRLFFDPAAKYKQYGIDGNVVPVVKDDNKNGVVDGADFVYLVFGMRRGGPSLYALNVTNKNAPQLLWIKNEPGFGQTWSTPVVAKVDINTAGQNADKAVVIVGGGYDTVHDTASHPNSPDASGAGVYMFDLVSGAELWRAGPDAGADRQLSTMTRAFPNKLAVADVSGDGLADRMYASDLGGQIWRFDIFNGQAPNTLVAGGVLAQLGAEGLASPADADTRRFYTAPDISLFNDVVQERRFIAISIGSGYRAHPFDTSAVDRFYSVRDKNIFNPLTQAEYDSFTIVTEANLKEVAGQKQVVIDPNDRGWKFTLPGNQKVLSDSITFDNSVFFVAFSPDTNAAATCSVGRGTNFLYQVSVVNGDPVVNNLDALDPNDADDARRKTLAQGGIAPSPTVLFPSPNDPSCTGADCSPPPIMCVGVECDPDIGPNNPVRTLWTQDGIQ